MTSLNPAPESRLLANSNSMDDELVQNQAQRQQRYDLHIKKVSFVKLNGWIATEKEHDEE